MNTRLQQFLGAENISQSQLADDLGVAKGSISHILAGRNRPSYEFIVSLMQRYPQLSIEWLMLGKGKMYKDMRSESKVEVEEEAPSVAPAMQNIPASSEGIAPEFMAEDSPAEPNLFSSPEPTIGPNTPTATSQVSDIQRNIRKVLVLFDDGTYREI